MANPEHLKVLQRGVGDWNAWKIKEPGIPDLRNAALVSADLTGANFQNATLREADLRNAKFASANLMNADLRGADLRGADLRKALGLTGSHLQGADLRGANLSEEDLRDADFSGLNLGEANLSKTNLDRAELDRATLYRANLSGANLVQVSLREANLREANLSGANLSGAILGPADLGGANLSFADLGGANLSFADLSGANLSAAVLHGTMLVRTDLANAVLTGCRVYGISAWDVKLSESTKQQDLIITPLGEPEVTVDNIEVAQFVYQLLHNEKIRAVIDTVGRKGVLLLGRFTDGRIAVLERLREELRKRGYLPIVFNFDKPVTKDFTETVRLLAGLSKFVMYRPRFLGHRIEPYAAVALG
jgi:uncharacterized protein YjbI with pentapeptide repeats